MFFDACQINKKKLVSIDLVILATRFEVLYLIFSFPFDWIQSNIVRMQIQWRKNQPKKVKKNVLLEKVSLLHHQHRLGGRFVKICHFARIDVIQTMFGDLFTKNIRHWRSRVVQNQSEYQTANPIFYTTDLWRNAMAFFSSLK